MMLCRFVPFPEMRIEIFVFWTDMLVFEILLILIVNVK